MPGADVWFYFLVALIPLEKYFRSRTQSYDRELQRQRCKNLQRHGLPSAFLKQKLQHNRVVVVNSEVEGMVARFSLLQHTKTGKK
jgi:hypothetical protein